MKDYEKEIMEEAAKANDLETDLDSDKKIRFISTVPVVPQLSIALLLLIAVFGVTYIGTGSSMKSKPMDGVQVDNVLSDKNVNEKSVRNAFDGVSIEAKSAIVWDVNNKKVLFNKKGDEQLPLASVTKLMTALVASELIGPEDKIPISLTALRTEGDSGLLDGEQFALQNITDLMLITSSNDSAAALSVAAANIIAQEYDPEEVFVQAMNLRAEELGLTRTYFKNSTGLDISETEAGAYGTARDMAHLMSHIITHKNEAIELTNVDLTKITNENGAYHLAQNTNSVVNEINGLIASKTGYTELAGGNLVVALNAGLNRPIVVVVLGSSFQGRFDDTLDLIERTKTHILNETI